MAAAAAVAVEKIDHQVFWKTLQKLLTNTMLKCKYIVITLHGRIKYN